MPQWLKILLAMICFGILGLSALVFGGVYWVKENKDRLVGDARAAKTEGESYGRTHTRDECVTDGLTHLDTCGPVDFLCEVGVKLRMTSCMSVARGDAVCAGVPAPGDIFHAALWPTEECSRRGQGGWQACGRLMQGVEAECARVKR